AFQKMADAEIPGDRAYIGGLALVGKGRVAGDDEQPGIAREIGDQVLGQAIGEGFLLRIAAHIGEWQDGDRWLVGKRRRFTNALLTGRANAEDMYRVADVLDRQQPQIVEINVEPALYLVVHGTRDANAARFCQRLEPCGDIDAIAVEIGTLDDDVSQVD